MDEPRIRVATDADRRGILQTMTLAFAGDPMFRWLFPEQGQYLDRFAGFVEADAGQSIDFGATYLTDGAAAAAMWFPPSFAADKERTPRYLEKHMRPEIFDDLVSVVGQLEDFRPQEPHWYLDFIGVDTRWHGKGIGSTLLRHNLRLIDEAGLPAYLISSNPRNRPFYQRHGFEEVGTIQAGSSPRVAPMIRPPC